MNDFDYFHPQSAREATRLLQDHPGAMVLAGGTDLLVRMKGHLCSPSAVVDIKGLPQAREIRFAAKSGLHVGPAVTMRQVEHSRTILSRYPALAQGASCVGSVQIRNRATVVGNLCNAAPSADTAPGIILHGGRVRIAGPQGRRTMKVESFIQGPGETGLRRGEFVTGLQIPTPPGRTGSAYVRHTPRQAMDIAVVGVGVLVTLASGADLCQEIRIVLGAVAPVPMRAAQAEALLRGQELSAPRIEAAAEAAAAEARPITDVRASAGFRRELVRVLTQRMILAAALSARTPITARRAA